MTLAPMSVSPLFLSLITPPILDDVTCANNPLLNNITRAVNINVLMLEKLVRKLFFIERYSILLTNQMKCSVSEGIVMFLVRRKGKKRRVKLTLTFKLFLANSRKFFLNK